MLGAGGLIRAYTDGAVAAIESGDPITRVLHREIFVELDYTWLGKVENELRNRGVRMGETNFADTVTLTCLPLDGDAESFMSWMVDLTQGQSLITEGERLYFIEGNKIIWQEEQSNASCRESGYWKQPGICS